MNKTWFYLCGVLLKSEYLTFFSLQAGKEVWDVDESMKYWWSSYCPYWKQAFGYIESEDHILGLDQKVLMNSGLIGVEH